jgi:hypothetical protein
MNGADNTAYAPHSGRQHVLASDAPAAVHVSAQAPSRHPTHRSRSRSRSRDGRKQQSNNSNPPTPPTAARSTSALHADAAAGAAATAAGSRYSMQRYKSRPDNWSCPACRFSNYSWRNVCMNCSACKPSPTAAAAAERTGGYACSAGAAGLDSSSRNDPWSRQPVRDGWHTIRWVACTVVGSHQIALAQHACAF